MSRIRAFLSVIIVFCMLFPLLCFEILAHDVPNVYSSYENSMMQIALTFDDGPHPRYTPQILDILDRYGVCATFFVVGRNADAYPALVTRIFESGNEIGNHTYSHLKLYQSQEDDFTKELIQTSHCIERITHQKSILFRPPEGFYTKNIAKELDKMGYKLILWNIDTKDWAHTPISKIVDTVKKNIKSGDILLFHDFIAQKSPTPQALEILIPDLLNQGFQFVTVSQLLSSTA